MNQMSNEVVYVTGHRNPDTDSIVSAIAYAHLKQQLGVNAIACRLGEINSETEYLLDRFNVPEPVLLTDARAQLDEIEMDEPIRISKEATIREVIEMMEHVDKPVFAVVNHLNQLQGILTTSNISQAVLGDTAKAIELLRETPIEYISKAIDGKLIYAPETPRHDGKTSIIAIAATKLDNYVLDNRIVIVGNDTQAQLQVIAKNAAVLIVVWANNVAPMVIEAAREKGCAIIISGHGTMNTSRYLFYSSPIEKLMTTNLVLFNKAEFVEDVAKKVVMSRYRAYPVVDDQNHIFGFVSRYHLLNAKLKKLILVDHNELRQSVRGIEKADIIEIIDHHRIGDLSTNKPIVFRNEIVGSTATIITKLYLESGIDIEPDMAGLLLGAMISDTLNFKSPTTTPADIQLAQYLAVLASIDSDEFAKDIFTIASSLKGLTMESIMRHDMKEFTLQGSRINVSQYTLYQLNEVSGIAKELQAALEQHVQRHQIDLWLMVFTSVHDNGSIMLAAGKLCEYVDRAWPAESGHRATTFIEGVVSRKNQIIPKLSLVLRDYVE